MNPHVLDTDTLTLFQENHSAVVRPAEIWP